MGPNDQQRAPHISGVNASGEQIWVDYSANLMNVVMFFEPVSKHSLTTLESLRVMSTQYEKLSVGFWYVMEPRLSCMFHSETAQRSLDRLSLFERTLFDANNMIALHSGIRSVPAVLVVDSNGYLVTRFEGEISLTEIERSLQARIALSGYREQLPQMRKPERPAASLRSAAVMKQLGYANGDYVFGHMVVPESDQEFVLPDFYLLNTIYPFGAWYVSRDYIEGKNGSTVYISCGKDESVIAFAGAEHGAVLRLHTSIESPQHVSLGKDVRTIDGLMQVEIDEFRPYEILANAGSTDVLVSLQVISGTVQLFTVEFCPEQLILQSEHTYPPSRYR